MIETILNALHKNGCFSTRFLHLRAFGLRRSMFHRVRVGSNSLAPEVSATAHQILNSIPNICICIYIYTHSHPAVDRPLLRVRTIICSGCSPYSIYFRIGVYLYIYIYAIYQSRAGSYFQSNSNKEEEGQNPHKYGPLDQPQAHFVTTPNLTYINPKPILYHRARHFYHNCFYTTNST